MAYKDRLDAEDEQAGQHGDSVERGVGVLYHLGIPNSYELMGGKYWKKNAEAEVLGAAVEGSVRDWLANPALIAGLAMPALLEGRLERVELTRQGDNQLRTVLLTPGLDFKRNHLIHLALEAAAVRWNGPDGDARRAADYLAVDLGRGARQQQAYERGQREQTTLWQGIFELLVPTGLPVVHTAQSSPSNVFVGEDAQWMRTLTQLSKPGAGKGLGQGLAESAGVTCAQRSRRWTEDMGGGGWGGDGNPQTMRATRRSVWLQDGGDSMFVACIPTREADERGLRAARRVLVVAAASLEVAIRVRDRILAKPEVESVQADHEKPDHEQLDHE